MIKLQQEMENLLYRRKRQRNSMVNGYRKDQDEMTEDRRLVSFEVRSMFATCNCHYESYESAIYHITVFVDSTRS